MYFAANKDFPEKIFVFSIENEETFSVISKSIWNYGLLINTDVAITSVATNQAFKTAVVSAESKEKCSDEGISNYKDVLDTLAAFNIPTIAKLNLVKTMAYFMNNKIIDMTEYIDSVIVKFCEAYGREMEQEKIDEIQDGLTIKIKEIYGF